MRHVTLSSFGGINPRISEHNLDTTQATIAHDVKLRNGRLEAWRERCPYAEVDAGSLTLYLSGCHALGFRSQVQIADVAPDWGRSYLTGRAQYPEVMTVACNGTPTFSRLGVAPPTDAPFVSATASCSRASDARAYVYTYVNAWGEESAPSPASQVITVEDGARVLVHRIASPPSGYNITQVNLYRAVTGFRPQDVQNQKPMTDFLLVDTIPAGQNSYTDTVLMVNLGYPLETSKNQEPPTGLRNICSIDDTVRLAGCTTNRVYLSEPFQLHNWPAKYELTLDHNIVHMGNMNDKLYVTTDSIPYIIRIGDCEDSQCNQVQRGASALPDIGCSYTHAAIMTKHGYVFSTPLGLVLLRPDATHVVLTAKWFSPEEWARTLPHTVRLGYYQGFLICVTDRVTLCLNIDGDLYGDMRGTELVTLSDRPVDLITSGTGRLFILDNGQVSVWDSADTLRPFYWESRPLTGQNENPNQTILVPTHVSPRGAAWSAASAKVKSAGGVQFTLLTPQPGVTYTRSVADEEPFRLPRIGRHLWYKVRLQGTSPTEFVTLGTAHFTVNRGA